MIDAHVEPDQIAYHNVINVFFTLKRHDHVLRMFNEMLSSGFKATKSLKNEN